MTPSAPSLVGTGTSQPDLYSAYENGSPQAIPNTDEGWSIGLPGVKVGSRVLLQIPPAYGRAGNRVSG